MTHSDFVDWLMDAGTPSIRYLTARNLLNQPDNRAYGSGIVLARRGQALAGQHRIIRAEGGDLYLGTAEIHPDAHDFAVDFNGHLACRTGRFVAKAYRKLTLSLYQRCDAGDSSPAQQSWLFRHPGIGGAVLLERT